MLDLTQLVPLWIGAFSLLGLVLGMPGLRNRAVLAVHLGLSYLSVSLVFYDARFALYALPFYAMVAMALLLEVPVPGLAKFAAASRVRLAFAAVVVLASGALAVHLESSALRNAPRQIHDAAQKIRATGIHGRVIARKPHVAWFAGTSYVPLPAGSSLTDLLALGRAEGAAFLYFSAMEIQARPDLEFLAEPDVRLPGLESFASARLDSAHFYTLYRLTGEVPSPSEIDSALVHVLTARVARRPSYIAARNVLAGHLLRLNRFAEALVQAESTVVLAPDDAAAWGILSAAAWRTGDLEHAAQAGDRALALGHTWWIELQMGKIRTEQRRFDDALAHFERALAENPASLDVLLALGQARLLSGDPEGARDELKRALMLAPNDASLRAQCAGLLRQAGREDLAREIETVR
jgi:tetratricopeptide (TPR) repeat protein